MKERARFPPGWLLKYLHIYFAPHLPCFRRRVFTSKPALRAFEYRFKLFFGEMMVLAVHVVFIFHIFTTQQGVKIRLVTCRFPVAFPSVSNLGGGRNRFYLRLGRCTGSIFSPTKLSGLKRGQLSFPAPSFRSTITEHNFRVPLSMARR